jgi:chemotaxis response regulator CheB
MCLNLPASGITVLVIEDSAPVRQRMMAELREVHEVEALTSAPNLTAALRGITSGKPDVVILDIQGTHPDVIFLLKRFAPWVRLIVFTNLAVTHVLADPSSRAPIRSAWDGLERFH